MQFIIITGDLNFDRLKPDLREGKILHDIEEIHGLTCMITKATRVTKDSQTLLDVILTNKPELFRECNVYNPENSDHAMVYGALTEKAIYYPNKVISVKNFKNLNVENLQNDLKMAPWHIGGIFDSVDDQYSFWNSLLNNISNDHVPLKRVRARDVPYMTTDWKNAIRNKRRYSKRYIRNPTEENFHMKNKWRNEATRIRQKAIEEYCKVKTKEIKSNPKESYKVFKPFLHSSTQGNGNSVINLNVNGYVEKDQRNVANRFAKYFSTVATDIGDANEAKHP